MPTIAPLLSILIPSTPRRLLTMAAPLIAKLEAQIGDQPVEILCFTDNKTRSVGLKRQALMDIARGEYLCFIDDDDDVVDDFVPMIVGLLKVENAPCGPGKEIPVDVVVFDQLATIDDRPPALVKFGVEFENTELGPDGATRKPWMCCVWRTRLARLSKFPDCSYGEDAAWAEPLWPRIVRQHRIEKILHYYRFRTDVTEAEHTFPPGTENDHPPEKDIPEYAAVLHRFAGAILPVLGRPRTVLDLGSNIGMWSRAFTLHGCKVMTVDSPHMLPHLVEPRPEFIAHDLRKPLRFYFKFDLALCLEVAEHLPPESADVLVDTLTYFSDMILFSAATPGQGGHKHLNEQPHNYWIKRFEDRGFFMQFVSAWLFDENPDLPAYYRKNMMIFRRSGGHR